MTSRGRVIARIEPEGDPSEEARVWLEDLRGKVVLTDVVAPFADVTWSADADHL